MQIWRFEIGPDLLDENHEMTLVMPTGAGLLHVETKDGKPNLWAMVDPREPKIARKLFIIGTGHDFPWYIGQISYIGTFTVKEFGTLVFHVFDRGEVLPQKPGA